MNYIFVHLLDNKVFKTLAVCWTNHRKKIAGLLIISWHILQNRYTCVAFNKRPTYRNYPRLFAPPPHPRLPQPAIAPTLGRTHGRKRQGTASLATSADLTSCDFFFWEFVRNSVFLSPLPHYLSQLPSQKSIMPCCHRYGQKWIIGLASSVSLTADTYSTYEVLKKRLIEFIFPIVDRKLQSFRPFQCTNFVKCLRELWTTLYLNGLVAFGLGKFRGRTARHRDHYH